MASHVSASVPGGHLVLVDLPDEVRVTAEMLGEETPRDITDWFADLVLLGLGVRHENEESGKIEPEESVEIANVTMVGADIAEARVFYIHHPSGVAASLAPEDALDACSSGIAAQITAGVAHDVAVEELGSENEIPTD